MPGAYAHITLVNEFRNGRTLKKAGCPSPIVTAVKKWFKFCELGAVSPDYPYLVVESSDAKRWADLMHLDHSGEMIHAGVRRLRRMTGIAADKCAAWLLGYSSHVVMDATVHPVVEMKVGKYEENKRAHRVCEMHQDTYIYKRLKTGPLQLAEHLKTGIVACGDNSDPSKLDRDVAGLWLGMLQDVHGYEASRNPPDIHKWHGRFKFGVDKIAEEGGLWPLARHVAMIAGVSYPPESDVDFDEYITSLATPAGSRSYDSVFDQAVQNVATRWSAVASSIADAQRDDYLAAVGSWNLDTGRDDATSEFVFWSVA
jgi:hypothetical protein